MTSPRRRVASRVLGVVGVALYNWWVVAALDGTVSSLDELFSDLEAQGQRSATLLSRVDVAAGLLLLLALLLRGRPNSAAGRSVRPWLLVFALSAVVGGHFPYVCAEGASSACRTAEWHLRLPLRHYLHLLSGIAEFAAATVAVFVAWRQRAGLPDLSSRAVRGIGWVLVVGYPVLGAAYLTDRFGVLVEPIFFLSFSGMVLVELFDPAGSESAGR
jgi:hypothetical protein